MGCRAGADAGWAMTSTTIVVAGGALPAQLPGALVVAHALPAYFDSYLREILPVFCTVRVIRSNQRKRGGRWTT